MKSGFLVALVIGIVLAGVGWRIYSSSTRPKLGDEVADMGREHVTDIYGVKYNSNPPTSGPHFPIWAKRGLYDRLISDGYLIHSLEHGYIVISYNCEENNALGLVKSVYAHEEPTEESTDSGQLLMHMNLEAKEGMSYFTSENSPEVEIELPGSFQSESCRVLVSRLEPFLEKTQRLIIVPRVDLDSKIALTAWGRILKLGGPENETIEDFIKAYHNRGPEATVE